MKRFRDFQQFSIVITLKVSKVYTQISYLYTTPPRCVHLVGDTSEIGKYLKYQKTFPPEYLRIRNSEILRNWVKFRKTSLKYSILSI